MPSFKSKGLLTTKDSFVKASIGSFSHLNSANPATNERSYTTTAYYHPLKDRGNLVVLTGAVVEKILFDEESCHGIKANSQTVLSVDLFLVPAPASSSPSPCSCPTRCPADLCTYAATGATRSSR